MRNYSKESLEAEVPKCIHGTTLTNGVCVHCRKIILDAVGVKEFNETIHSRELHHTTHFPNLTVERRAELMRSIGVRSISTFAKLLKQCRKHWRDTRRQRPITDKDRELVIDFYHQSSQKLLQDSGRGSDEKNRHKLLYQFILASIPRLSKEWNISRRQLWHLFSWCRKQLDSASVKDFGKITKEKVEYIQRKLKAHSLSSQKLNNEKYDEKVRKSSERKQYGKWSKELHLFPEQIHQLVWRLKQAPGKITLISKLKIREWIQNNRQNEALSSEDYSELCNISGLSRSQIQKFVANQRLNFDSRTNSIPDPPNQTHQSFENPHLTIQEIGKSSLHSESLGKRNKISMKAKAQIRKHLELNETSGIPIPYKQLEVELGLTKPQLHNQVFYMRKRKSTS